EDILVGYPLVGKRKLDRLADLAGRVSVSVTVDSEVVALGISRMAAARGLTIPVLLELDSGMHRLGVPPGPDAVELAERVAALDGIELIGVFTHEGHVYTQAHDAAEQERMTLEACAAAVETAEQIRSRGIGADVVSVGSAATFRHAIRCPGVTEVRPGTYVFNDRSQLAQGSAGPSDLAAFVVTTVVARPAPDRIVVDAGTKVLTSDRMLVPEPPATFGFVSGHDDWDVGRLEAVGEFLLQVGPDRVLRPRCRRLRRERLEQPPAHDRVRVHEQPTRLAHRAEDVVEREAPGEQAEDGDVGDRPGTERSSFGL